MFYKYFLFKRIQNCYIPRNIACFCFAIRNLFSNPPLIYMSLRKGYFPPQSAVSIRLPNELQLLRSVHVFYCQCLQFLEIFFDDIQTLIETKLLQTIADAAVSRQWYCCWSYKCIIVFLIKFLPQNVATTRWDPNQSIYISIAETTSYRTKKVFDENTSMLDEGCECLRRCLPYLLFAS